MSKFAVTEFRLISPVSGLWVRSDGFPSQNFNIYLTPAILELSLIQTSFWKRAGIATNKRSGEIWSRTA